MFGFLGSSQKLLYVLSDLFRLADDVLCAWQGGILLGFLPQLHGIRSCQRPAAK